MLRVGREVTPRSLNLRVRQLGKSRRERLRAPPVYVTHLRDSIDQLQ